MSSWQPEEECKYKHLLQPIRDLAANWDINIASDLEEYLGVLEHLTFSFDGGLNLNFAEAALLIQGSACVYSKKVEHLHGLVHQVLSVISDKSRQRTEAGGQPTVDDVDEFDDEETFLNLDDVLQEGAGIDLEEGAAAEHEASSQAPTVLLALEDTGQSQGDGSASTYRIAACSVHKSGALLLEDREGQFWDENLVRLQSAEQPLQQQCTLDDWPWPEAGMQGAEQHDVADTDAAPADMGPGFDADGDDAPAPLEPMDGPGNENTTGRQTGFAAGAQQAQAGPQRRREAPQAEIKDPYEPLDPGSAGDLPLRPFRKSKPRRKRLCKAPKAEERPFVAPEPGSLGSLSYPEFGYVLRAHQAAQRAQQAASRSQMTHAWAGGADGLEDEHIHDTENLDDTGEEQYDTGTGFEDDGGYDDDGQAQELSFDDLADAAASGQPNYDAINASHPQAAELSYEELCAAHTEARMAAAAAAEVQTELASRVAGWRSKIAPVLEEQDARGDFDIHTVGESLLNDMAAVSLEDPAEAEKATIEKAPSLAFGAVVKQQHKWQVSRLFSALLQLANNGNVVILRGPTPGQPFQLRLASLENKHQHFQDYRAPSFLQAKDLNVPEGESQGIKGGGTPTVKKAEASTARAGARKAPPKKRRRRRQAV